MTKNIWSFLLYKRYLAYVTTNKFQMITLCPSIRHSDCGFPVTVTSWKLACFS
jgi:hypothetical protein